MRDYVNHRMKIKPLTLFSKHLSDTHTQCTRPCSNQCWLETGKCNDQNFLERLSWSALLLNLVAGDLPGEAPLPARGDMLGGTERKRMTYNQHVSSRWTLNQIRNKFIITQKPNFYILLLLYSQVVMSLTKNKLVILYDYPLYEN